MIFAGALTVERQFELLFPVEGVARVAHGVIHVTCSLAAAGNIGGMRGDFIGDNALAHVGSVGQPQVFLRRDVTQHRRAVPAAHGRTDRRGNMIVPCGDIGDQRPQNVKRCFMAQFALQLHVAFDLIERHVSRAFDHDLHIFFPGAQRQFAQHLQFAQLRFVAGIGQASRAQRIAQRKRYVVAAADVENLVVRRIKRIFAVIVHHPRRHQRTAPADDTHFPLGDFGHGFKQETRMNREIAHALLRLALEHFKHFVDRQVLDLVTHIVQNLVDGHRADGNFRIGDDGFANLVEVAAGRKVHRRIGFVML